MAVVLGEVANALVRIEEDVFVPTVGDAFDLNGAPLKADDFVVGAANLAARAQGNERAGTSSVLLRIAAESEIGIFGVEDANGNSRTRPCRRGRTSAA